MERTWPEVGTEEYEADVQDFLRMLAADRGLDYCANGHPGRPAGEPCGPCEDERLALGRC